MPNSVSSNEAVRIWQGVILRTCTVITSVHYHHSTPLWPLIKPGFHLDRSGSEVLNFIKINLLTIPQDYSQATFKTAAEFLTLTHLALQDSFAIIKCRFPYGISFPEPVTSNQRCPYTGP